MSQRTYILDPSNERAKTLGLLPGVHFFKSRLTRGGPYVGVRTAVIEDRDDSGELICDTHYEVTLNGVALRFEQWEHMSLIGDEVTEADYKHLLADTKYLGGLGVEVDKKVDLTTLPPILP